MTELEPVLATNSPVDSDNSGYTERDQFRLSVVTEALNLFKKQGYEATTVDEIAEASGVSRRTFFRQFHSKEDVIFADHELLLEQVSQFLNQSELDPWQRVCESSRIVFLNFYNRIEFSRLRYEVVRSIPALRDREIVTVFRYEKLYSEFLRSHLPKDLELKAITFSAAATATHNSILRQMIRDGGKTTVADLDRATTELRSFFQLPVSAFFEPKDSDTEVTAGGSEETEFRKVQQSSEPGEILLAVLPKSVSASEISAKLQELLK